MKTLLLVLISFTFPVFGTEPKINIQYADLTTQAGVKIQVCSRYPDTSKFPGKRPVLFFIQGSGKHDACLRLKRSWATGIVNRGVAIYAKQKRGIRVDLHSGTVKKDQDAYLDNDLNTLKSDSVLALRHIFQDMKVDANNAGLAGGSEGAWLVTSVAQLFPQVKELTLISAAIERFDRLFERQISELVPMEVISAFDSDEDSLLSYGEIDENIFASSGLLAFGDIDNNLDGKLDSLELGSEFRRATLYSLATNNSTFLASDIGGGVSVKWLRSAYRELPLGPRILDLSMPVYIHHGINDVNTLVEPVVELEETAKTQGKRNINFQYYEGVGHALTKDILYNILFGIADRLNGY